MAIQEPRTLRDMAGSKGDFPLRYRQHALRLARQAIEKLLAEGVTQKEIGRRLGGLSQGHISEIKNGGLKLGVRLLLALRYELRMSLDDILGLPPLDVPEPPPSGDE